MNEKLVGRSIVGGFAAVAALGIGYWAFSGDDAPEAAKPAAVTAPAPVPAQPPVVTYAPQVQAPVASQPAATAKPGDTADEKKTKLALLEMTDLNFLNNRGYKVNARLGVGRDCNADNTVTDGWKGTSSSISYSVTKSGKLGTVCVSHSGKNGSKVAPSDFIPR